MPSFDIPVLRDAVEPSDFVSAYKDLAPPDYIGRLAPSLGLLITYKLYRPTAAISKEFVDSELFLGITELPPFLEALKDVNRTLQAPSGSITLPLTHEMGFGKTHFEVLLFHLYTEVPKRWREIRSRIELEDAVEKLTVESFYKPDIAEKTIVLALDLKSLPEFMDPYTALFENCARLIKKYKGFDEKFIEFVRALSKTEPMRAATDLANFIKKTGVTTPILIILDELYAKVFETAKGGDQKQIESLEDLLIFITSFIDALREHSPIVLVYASAQQDIGRWEDLAKLKDYLAKFNPEVASLISVVEHFKDRTSRTIISMRQMTSEDAMEVVLKRLIRYKAPREELSRLVASVCMDIVKNYTEESIAIEYYEHLLRTYPFVPTYRFFAEKLLTPTIGGDLPKTQHIRDLLKISASLISKMYESDEWDRVSLISLAYLTHEDVNHLLDERYSMEWGRLYSTCKRSIDEIRDEDIRFLAERMLSIVYLKSLTTNILKLIDAIRKPEVIPREEILSRGTSFEDLIFSLVGAISNALLPKLHDAFDRLSKSPSIVDVEHEFKKYLLMSFVFNPMDLIESFKNEEMAKFITPDGVVNYQQMVEYLRSHLEREYNITGEFARKSQEVNRPKLVLINYNIILAKNESGKPKFLNYLDKDRFTILVLTPWSIAKEIIESKELVDFTEKVRETLQNFRDKIIYPNMLAVVLPEIGTERLQRLCTRIAEVRAAGKVVSYLKVEELEEMRRRRLELARRAPTYQTLIDLLKERGEKFEEIILEVMDILQNKIENYAKSYTNTAVQDYVTELIGSFKNIVYLNVKENIFIKDTLNVRPEIKETKEDRLRRVYAELPAWIADATISRCGVDRQASIGAKLIKYVIEPYVYKNRDQLIRGEKVEIEVNPLIEASMKGWIELPIRPLSRGEMEKALVRVTGSRLIAGMNVKISRLIKREAIFIVIELVKRPPPPPPPPVNFIEVIGIGDIILGMGLFREDKLGNNVKTIDISIETEDGCVFYITNASLGDLEWIIGDDPINTFINRISPISPEIKFAKLRIKLVTPIEREKAEEILRSLGISNYNIPG